MNVKQEKTFDFVVEVRTRFNIQGDGRTEFEAQQDAIARYHRLNKANELGGYFDTETKPVIVKTINREPTV